MGRHKYRKRENEISQDTVPRFAQSGEGWFDLTKPLKCPFCQHLQQTQAINPKI